MDVYKEERQGGTKKRVGERGVEGGEERREKENRKKLWKIENLR